MSTNSDPIANSGEPTVLEFMRTRRSVPAKAMQGPGPDDQTLLELLEIAARVPDHGKLAPWRFVIYGPNKRREIGKVLAQKAKAQSSTDDKPFDDQIEALELNRFLRAPTVVGVISSPKESVKVPQWEQQLSAGAVCMNLLIAANAAGYDAQWLTEWYAFDREVYSVLGVNEGEQVAGFVHIGTRINPKTERARPNLDELITRLD